ncbi:unnamed protein product [Gordionus sp. m RMFG-2023]|uniref:uncharacterized protein LOC135928076 n=1 Tax=Gordionus sp. m RMFG-2023 TaxID=3053472 RepID=UPI0030DF5E25
MRLSLYLILTPLIIDVVNCGYSFDPYERIGVSHDASLREIKKAYRKKAIEFHPDKNKDSKSQNSMLQLNEAYQILSNENERRLYDEKYLLKDRKIIFSDSSQASYLHSMFKNFDYYYDFPTNGFYESIKINQNYFENKILQKSHNLPIIIIVYSKTCIICYNYESQLEQLSYVLENTGIHVYTVDNNYKNFELVKKLNVGRVGPSFVGITNGKIKVFNFGNYDTFEESEISSNNYKYSDLFRLFGKKDEGNLDKGTLYRNEMLRKLLSPESFGDSDYRRSNKLTIVTKTLLALIRFVGNNLFLSEMSGYSGSVDSVDNLAYRELHYVYNFEKNYTNSDSFLHYGPFLKDNKIRILIVSPQYYKIGSSGSLKRVNFVKETPDPNKNGDNDDYHSKSQTLLVLNRARTLKYLALAYRLQHWARIIFINVYYPANDFTGPVLEKGSGGLLSSLFEQYGIGCLLGDPRFKSKTEEIFVTLNELSQLLRLSEAADRVCSENLYYKNFAKGFDPFFASHRNLYLLSYSSWDSKEKNSNYVDFVLRNVFKISYPRGSIPFKMAPKVRDIVSLRNQHSLLQGLPRITDELMFAAACPSVKYHELPKTQHQQGIPTRLHTRAKMCSLLLIDDQDFNKLVLLHSNPGKINLNNSGPSYALLSTMDTLSNLNSHSVKEKLNYSIAYLSLQRQAKFLDSLLNSIMTDQKRQYFMTFLANKLKYAHIKTSFDSDSEPNKEPSNHNNNKVVFMPILSLVQLPLGETRYRLDLIPIRHPSLPSLRKDYARDPTVEPFSGYDMLFENTAFPDARAFNYLKNAMQTQWKSFTNTPTPPSSSEKRDHHFSSWYHDFYLFFASLLRPELFGGRIYRELYSGKHSRQLPVVDRNSEDLESEEAEESEDGNDNNFLYRYFMKARTTAADSAEDDTLEIDLAALFPGLSLSTSRLQDYVVDEFKPHLVTRAYKKAKAFVSKSTHRLMNKIHGVSGRHNSEKNFGKDDALTVLSVIFSFVFVLGGGYFMAYLVKLEEDKIAEENRNNPVKLPNRIINQDMIFHELKPGTYNALVRLLKPGCRTILIFLDEPTKDKLLDKFSHILHPYRKNVSLMFGFVMISKYISWYRRLLLQVIGNNRKLVINPKNCVGTVLVVNGYRKYYCIYHARHYEASIPSSNAIWRPPCHPADLADDDNEDLDAILNTRSKVIKVKIGQSNLLDQNDDQETHESNNGAVRRSHEAADNCLSKQINKIHLTPPPSYSSLHINDANHCPDSTTNRNDGTNEESADWVKETANRNGGDEESLQSRTIAKEPLVKVTKKHRSHSRQRSQHDSGKVAESQRHHHNSHFTSAMVEELLRGFPDWLDKLFEGNVQRYYIDYWPPLKI